MMHPWNHSRLLFALLSGAPTWSGAAPLPSSYAPVPEAVTSFGAAVHDGWLYVYGGHLGERHEYSAGEVSGACRRLRLDEGTTWEDLPADAPAQSPALVAHGSSLYRIGGMAARNAPGQPQDLHSHGSVSRLDPAAHRWEALAPLPAARSSHDAAVLGHRVYVAGGWNLSGDSASAQWHDTALSLELDRPETGWQSLPQPFKRRGLAVVALGTRLFCVGGMTDDDEPSNAVDVLDTVTGRWSQGPALPEGGRMKGFGAAACALDGRLYVNGLSGEVWRLTTDGSAWEACARLRAPRFFHRLVPAASDRLLAVSGAAGRAKTAGIEWVPLKADAARDWPGYRGPNRDGHSIEPLDTSAWGKGGPPVLWRAAVGAGMSSFAVTDGRVFTLGNANEQDTVWCLNALDGALLWRFDYACTATNHPMPIVPAGPAATPAVSEGRLYTLSREGQLHCLEAQSGRLLWKRHLVDDLGGKRPVYGYANSPLAVDGRVYLDLGGTNGSTAALEAATGSVLWRRGTGEAGYSSPQFMVHGGKRTLVLFKGEALTLLNPETGDVLDAFETTTRDFCNTVMPAMAGGSVFASNTGQDGTIRLDVTDESLRVAWRRNDLGCLFNSPMIWKGRLHAFNDARRQDNEFLCLDAATGKTLWQFDGVEKGVFTMTDGLALVLTRQSEFVVLDLNGDRPEVRARFQPFGGKSYTEPVLSGGRIYCRNNRGEVAVLGASVEGENFTSTPTAGGAKRLSTTQGHDAAGMPSP